MPHNQVFIFAAGYGKRMLPVTATTPKPLIKVNDQPLIERLLLQLKAQGITSVTINVGHLGSKVIDHLGSGQKYGVAITYSDEGPTPKETAGGIRFAIEKHKLTSTSPIITINSDLVTDFDFSSLIDLKPKKCHLVLVKNPKHNTKGDFGMKNGLLTQNDTQYTYSGIGVFNPDFLLQNNSFTKLGNLINHNIDDISCEVFAGIWHDIGTQERLEELSKK